MLICKYKMKKKAEAPGGRRGVAPGMPDDAMLEVIGARFRALGEPSRLKLLRVLLEGEKSVGELVEATGLSQANTSRHLQTLTDAGILGRRKEGVTVVYSIIDATIPDLCRMVCDSVVSRSEAQLRQAGPWARLAS